MLASIHPLGERAKDNRWSHTATAFAFGSLAGGTTMGMTAGALGALVTVTIGMGGSVQLTLVLLTIALSVLLDTPPLRSRLPSTRRQVDEKWLTLYRGWVYGVGYGFQLGLGVATVVSTAAVYATVALAALTGSVVLGAVVGGTFGLVRGLAILPAHAVTTPDGLRRFHRRLDQRRRLAARITPAAQAFVGLAVVGMIVIT